MTNTNIKKDNQQSCSNTSISRKKHNSCERDYSIFNKIKYNIDMTNKNVKEDNNYGVIQESEYSTLDLIEDLRLEIQKYPEILFQLFPHRYRYNHNQLSLFWRGGKNINYVIKLMAKFKNKINFSIDNKDLEMLEKRLRGRFGNRASNCFHFIKQYKFKQRNFKIFIESMKKELGQISGDIKVTYGELAILLGKHEDYIYSLRKYILNPTNRRHNPNYKFDLETLQEFKVALRILLKEKTKNSLSFINKYINLNPDLKEYLFERVTIKNPHYFNSIDTIEKTYWFGFICADALVKQKYRYTFKFELSSLDRERLVKLAGLLGYDIERIKDRKRRYYDDNGKLKIKEYSCIQFKSKRMIEELLGNGYSSSAMGTGLPEIVKKAEEDIALAFLLGFFDGDGSWCGGRSAEIYTSNKMFLMEIKKKFKIEYPIRTTKKALIDKYSGEIIHRASHRLTLGANLYEKMMRNYPYSMKRKRAPQFRDI